MSQKACKTGTSGIHKTGQKYFPTDVIYNEEIKDKALKN